jgi:hypothetical protein
MKKIFITIFILSLPVFVFSQEKLDFERVTLNNGTVYVGKITVHTESVVMLQTKDGARFQFPATDVKSIEPLTETDLTSEKNTDVTKNSSADVGIMLSAGSSVFTKNTAFASAGALQVDIVLGAKNVDKQNLFIGLGAGYENIFAKPENVHILQIFGRVHKIFGTQRVAPFVSADLGYAIVADEGWSGGILARVSGGVSFKLSAQNNLFLGLNLSLQSSSTTLTENLNGVPYRYYGNVFLPKAGLLFGVIF